MISRTVSIPANFDCSLFQRGAETTPVWEMKREQDARRIRTIEEETLKSFFHIQFCVENDEAEANGKSIVRGVALEEGADCGEGSIMGLLGWIGRIGRDM